AVGFVDVDVSRAAIRGRDVEDGCIQINARRRGGKQILTGHIDPRARSADGPRASIESHRASPASRQRPPGKAHILRPDAEIAADREVTAYGYGIAPDAGVDMEIHVAMCAIGAGNRDR